MTNRFPYIIQGHLFKDKRGKLFSCNQFDMTRVKRMYSIENINSTYIRGWKGHKIETRWFFATKGSIIINTVLISDLEKAHHLPAVNIFKLSENNFNVLEVPPGFATSIRQYSNGDRICVLADFKIGVSDDEDLRWDL
jgi:dTDP-4-dehydrorhamnose 3,5-epimerase-like enzyme